MNNQDLINKLINTGSFDLTQNEEFNNLSRSEKISVRRVVRFNLLMESQMLYTMKKLMNKIVKLLKYLSKELTLLGTAAAWAIRK